MYCYYKWSNEGPSQQGNFSFSIQIMDNKRIAMVQSSAATSYLRPHRLLCSIRYRFSNYVASRRRPLVRPPLPDIRPAMSDGSSIPESAHLILPSNAKILLDIWQRSQFMAWLPFRGCCSDASSPTYQLAGPSEQWVSSHQILSFKNKTSFKRPWINTRSPGFSDVPTALTWNGMAGGW